MNNPPPALTVKLQLALSALMGHCQDIIDTGQLDIESDRELSRLLHDIKKVLNERTDAS